VEGRLEHISYHPDYKVSLYKREEHKIENSASNHVFKGIKDE
jgi:hypothetical protein